MLPPESSGVLPLWHDTILDCFAFRRDTLDVMINNHVIQKPVALLKMRKSMEVTDVLGMPWM